MPLDERAKRRFIIDVLEGDLVDREAPRVDARREGSAGHTDPRGSREWLSTANGLLGLQQRAEADQSQPERETGVQVCPEREQRRPEPRRASPIERGEQKGGEEQGDDLGSYIEEPMTAGGDEPGGGAGGQPGAADPPCAPRDQGEENDEQGEIEPGDESRMASPASAPEDIMILAAGGSGGRYSSIISLAMFPARTQKIELPNR